MGSEISLYLLLAVPAGFSVLALLPRSPRVSLLTGITGVLLGTLASITPIVSAFSEVQPSLESSHLWLTLDALSAYHLVVLEIIFLLSSAFSWVYFCSNSSGVNFTGVNSSGVNSSGSNSSGEVLSSSGVFSSEGGQHGGWFTIRQARLFSSLWAASFSAMALVLVSNNLGLMWVGIEATTVITAFLICIHLSRSAIEAMWKYLLICSVGISLAFLGTLLVANAANNLPIKPEEMLLWTALSQHASALNPTMMKAAFIFLLVGYGTKAGLAPFHTWLPDAHSKAPAPVSAVFSGFMLNTALYCLMRFLPLVEGAMGDSPWARNLLTALGLISIVIASAFILYQKDLKRLLAYHSVEHLGIITLGLGLGGIGTFAALFHTLNHSLCKTLAFFAAGRLGQIAGTHDMEHLTAAAQRSRLWGMAIFIAILALIGSAPFSLFMSEFQILKAAVDSSSYFALVVFLLGTGAVFVGALLHAIPITWGEAHTRNLLPIKSSLLEKGLVLLPILALLLLGLWMPNTLEQALLQATSVVQGDSQLLVLSRM